MILKDKTKTNVVVCALLGSPCALSHPLTAELIVILPLTLLVITGKDSAPLNDELCV